jgi:hypothetical protein
VDPDGEGCLILNYHRHDRVVHVSLHTKSTQRSKLDESELCHRCCAFSYGCAVYCVRTCRVSSPGVLNVFGCGNGPALTSTSVRFADEFLRIHNCAIVPSQVDHSTQLHSSVTWRDVAHIYVPPVDKDLLECEVDPNVGMLYRTREH